MLVPEPVQSSQCGLKKSAAQGNDYIHNGQEAKANEWPWMASIKSSKSGQEGWDCAGAVIGEEWIITAAHCLVEKDRSPRHDSKDIKIYLGDHDLKANAEPNESQVYGMESYVAHKQYWPWDKPMIRNDIALIKVSKKIDLNLHTPVCLPGRNEDFTGSNVTLLGWDAHAIWGWPRFVKTTRPAEAPFLIQDPSVCDKRISGFTSDDSPSTLCLAGLGTRLCPLQTGGPITIEDGEFRRHKLVGIVSFGEPNKCDESKLIPSASVAYYRDWIKEKTGGI